MFNKNNNLKTLIQLLIIILFTQNIFGMKQNNNLDIINTESNLNENPLFLLLSSKIKENEEIYLNQITQSLNNILNLTEEQIEELNKKLASLTPEQKESINNNL